MLQAKVALGEKEASPSFIAGEEDGLIRQIHTLEKGVQLPYPLFGASDITRADVHTQVVQFGRTTALRAVSRWFKSTLE